MVPSAAVTQEMAESDATRTQANDENERHTSWSRRPGAARVAQRAETEAIAAVQKTLGAEADTRARLEQAVLGHQSELSEAAPVVQEAR